MHTAEHILNGTMVRMFGCTRSTAAASPSSIGPESLHVCGIDSYTTEAYFSARREGVQCGRIINAIKLT